jgi:hypothetical protein
MGRARNSQCGPRTVTEAQWRLELLEGEGHVVLVETEVPPPHLMSSGPRWLARHDLVAP